MQRRKTWNGLNKMEIVDTNIQGLKILSSKIFKDDRGKFIKIFTKNPFAENGLDINIKEIYYSISHKNVIRGMHFQIPPFDHIKLVHVLAGRIVDVVLDIRKNSPTYGKFFSCELSSNDAKVIIIPKGLAHGFKSMEDNTVVIYMQTSCYSPDHDYGIRYDSFGFDWECDNPIISDRDLKFPKFNEFITQFEFGEY